MKYSVSEMQFSYVSELALSRAQRQCPCSVCADSEGLLCRGMTWPICEKVYSVTLERESASGVGQGERLRSQLRTERREHDTGIARAAAGTRPEPKPRVRRSTEPPGAPHGRYLCAGKLTLVAVWKVR